MNKLQLARSTYFYNKTRLVASDKYASLKSEITDIFTKNYSCYGYRRIVGTLRRQNTFISEKVVRRLMSEENLKVITTRKKGFNSYFGEISPAPNNILQRDFKSEEPNKKWLTDITEIRLPAGKVYVSPMIDCFDGLIVSWSIGTTANAELVNSMLDKAISTLKTGERPIVHSDRGAHYRWPDWIKKINSVGITRSMSKKGYSPDNAACEGFFGRFKNEFLYNRNWQNVTIQNFIEQVNIYIKWYNEKRIKKSLGFKSPLEYRRGLGLIY